MQISPRFKASDSYLRELRRGSDQTLRDNFKKKMDFICRA